MENVIRYRDGRIRVMLSDTRTPQAPDIVAATEDARCVPSRRKVTCWECNQPWLACECTDGFKTPRRLDNAEFGRTNLRFRPATQYERAAAR